MRPRVEEILEEVRACLDAAGFEHLPSQQIVLTGGGSQVPGLDTLAPKLLGQQVRIGRPLRVQGLPQAATGGGFCQRCRPLPLRREPSGRMVGFRHAGRPLPGPVVQTSGKMV